MKANVHGNPEIYLRKLLTSPRQLITVQTTYEPLSPRLPPVASGLRRIHQSQLPPLPQWVRDLNKHIYGDEFREALYKEWLALRAMGCFKTSELVDEASADAEGLPLMWVFTYKIDEDGCLTAFNARLVVRGDLQAEVEDTYAATLAIRNFRALVAIANYFRLVLKQYNVPTAYLNAKLYRKLYARTPHGVE